MSSDHLYEREVLLYPSSFGGDGNRHLAPCGAAYQTRYEEMDIQKFDDSMPTSCVHPPTSEHQACPTDISSLSSSSSTSVLCKLKRMESATPRYTPNRWTLPYATAEWCSGMVRRTTLYTMKPNIPIHHISGDVSQPVANEICCPVGKTAQSRRRAASIRSAVQHCRGERFASSTHRTPSSQRSLCQVHLSCRQAFEFHKVHRIQCYQTSTNPSQTAQGKGADDITGGARSQRPGKPCSRSSS